MKIDDTSTIAYVVSDLKRVGPSNQTLNIINYSKYKKNSFVITLFAEQPDTMIDEFKKNNIEIICLGLNRTTFILTGRKKLLKTLESKNAIIAHSYGIKPDCLCNKVCKKAAITHIITLRNYPKEDILTRMNCAKGKIALHNHLRAILKCDNVICCSKTICKKMTNDHPQKKFSYIQNGVDTKEYNRISTTAKKELRQKYKLNNIKKIFISTGSFIQRKRIEETIAGFIKSNSNDILLLLGDGPLFCTLKKKYASYPNIIFYGKTENVKDLLQLSDVFISSSESEGLPNGVIEALACGLPVILSNIPQHQEIIDELPTSGKLYSLGNTSELANIIANENLENNLSIKDSPFAMDVMSKKYIKYYTDEVLQ